MFILIFLIGGLKFRLLTLSFSSFELVKYWCKLKAHFFSKWSKNKLESRPGGIGGLGKC
jgi:hypothetical protein